MSIFSSYDWNSFSIKMFVNFFNNVYKGMFLKIYIHWYRHHKKRVGTKSESLSKHLKSSTHIRKKNYWQPIGRNILPWKHSFGADDYSTKRTFPPADARFISSALSVFRDVPLPNETSSAARGGNHLINATPCHSDGTDENGVHRVGVGGGERGRVRARAHAIHALNTGARLQPCGREAAARPLAGRLRRTCFPPLARVLPPSTSRRRVFYF